MEAISRKVGYEHPNTLRRRTGTRRRVIEVTANRRSNFKNRSPSAGIYIEVVASAA